ncbi:short-chain dehydrogenase/reductase [Teratosphaeria nubilosa]|uniref:Short-chain dehydrogenase/reductase n=1 Tax=Teratosphaeria nubilosa TaxID=161662 RepID=A0A6G1LJH3_9PEZI|nr:short-chain dehydrogenase/reductase [Teratosphaeria nubilosa]
MDRLSFMRSFFYSQFFVEPEVPNIDCTGKTIIVTGSNVGLGKEAVRHYVRLNAEKVIIACRSPGKGEVAKKEIEESTKRSGVVDVWALDLADYDSIRAFAKRASGLKRIDILLENAAVQTFKWSTINGHESQVAINVISTFLLALLMLPKLQETARSFNVTPTLTIVSSATHIMTPFPERHSPSIFATLDNESSAHMNDRYPVSKLLEVLTCRELARHHPVEQLNATLNFVNPGLCQSALHRESDTFFVNAMLKVVARTSEVGGRTIANAGLAGSETHGRYLDDCVVKPCAPLVEGEEGPELQRRVWKELSEILNQIEPGVTKVLDA